MGEFHLGKRVSAGDADFSEVSEMWMMGEQCWLIWAVWGSRLLRKLALAYNMIKDWYWKYNLIENGNAGEQRCLLLL